jgi:hypothetical protein
MDIEINATKTKLLVLNNNKPETNEPIIINNSVVPRSHPDQGERLLGVYISASGSNKTQKDIINSFVNEAIATLEQKSMTDQMCVYIMNNVILPAIAYKTKLMIPDKDFYSNIDIKMRKIFSQSTKDFPSRRSSS